MKTPAYIYTLAALLILTTSAKLNASMPGMKLGDLKFLEYSPELTISTESNYTTEFDFEEEAYISDIPFDTQCVTANCRYKKAMEEVFELKEENYIDDIPFNNGKIAATSGMDSFDFEDEAYIDDIPFNTQKIAKNADLMNNLTIN